MNKSSQHLAQHRKRKTRLALCIRVIFFVSITSFYIISSILNDSNGNDINNSQSAGEYGGVHHSRNLLQINQSDIENGPSVIESNVFNATIAASTTTQATTSFATASIDASLLKNCTRAAILEIPSDGLTRNERQHGWIAVHVLLACYCFWLLARVCDEYFIASIELMCCTFNMNEDVVGATFMAAATSSPELFINCVGTFITKSDLGVGTVVGSAVFNVLAVPACCGLFAGKVVDLDWWPVSRDCLMYAVSVVSLICVLHDGKVMWYEGLGLMVAYFLYISVMYYNDIMARKARMMVAKLRRKSHVRPYRERTEITPLLTADKGSSKSTYTNGGNTSNGNSSTTVHVNNHLYPIEEDTIEYAGSPWRVSPDSSYCSFLLGWPITLVLWMTIPDCRKHPRLRMLTFFLCIFWIGATSYVVAMLITVVGDTLNIPDSVMGLTFLAAGTSVPEAVSSVIVTSQGHGAMGIANSLGSNTFDILLCLGLPWFIKAYFFPAVPHEHWITFNSTGLTYSAISLLSTLFGLYLAFALNKFRLDWKIGLTCTLMYIAFLIFASLIELNVFFMVNLPICPH